MGTTRVEIAFRHRRAPEPEPVEDDRRPTGLHQAFVRAARQDRARRARDAATAGAALPATDRDEAILAASRFIERQHVQRGGYQLPKEQIEMRNKSADIPIGGILNPQSVAAAGTATGTWVDARTAAWWVALCQAGALGGGVATFSVVQATDSSGTGAKAVSGTPGSATKAPTAGQGLVIDVDPQALDLANSFFFIAVKVSVAGGTGALVSGAVIGLDARYQ